MTEDILVDFILGPERNGWFKDRRMNVYVRKTLRTYQPEIALRPTFDIANISVRHPGTGVFTDWVGELRTVLPNFKVEYLYVESVLNSRFAASLERWGWTRDSKNGFFLRIG